MAATDTPFAEPNRATFVDVNRTTLRIWEWGDPGDPTIVCAHGAFDHGRMFDGIAPELAKAGFHVRAVDARGHGDSGRLPHGHTWQSSVVDFSTLVSLEEGPVGLLGHSMGAGNLMGAAGIVPEHVSWVVSLDSLGPPVGEFADFDRSEYVTTSFDYLVKTLGRGARVFPDRQAMVDQRHAINTRMPLAWMEHLVLHGSKPIDGGFCWKWDPLFNTGLMDGFDPNWVLEDFKAIEAPFLALMGGEEETWSTMPDWEVQERLAPIANHRLITVPGAGHYVHLEQPQLVLDAVLSFIDEVTV